MLFFLLLTYFTQSFKTNFARVTDSSMNSKFKPTNISYHSSSSINNSKHSNKNICYSSCPPWFEKCHKSCMQKIWYEQDQWIKKMNIDSEFREKALEYIPKPINRSPSSNKTKSNLSKPLNNFPNLNNTCYSACPPWVLVCTKQCMRTIWYKQEKWARMIKADPNFQRKAFEFIPEAERYLYRPKITTNNKNLSKAHNNNNNNSKFNQLHQNLQKAHQNKETGNKISSNKQECYSACPPWFIACTMQCMPNPWYKQQKWIRMIRTDPNFRKKALTEIPKEYRALFENERPFTRINRLNMKNPLRQPTRNSDPNNNHHSFDTDNHKSTNRHTSFNHNNMNNYNSNNHDNFNDNNVNSNTDKPNNKYINSKRNRNININRNNSSISNNILKLNQRCFSACPPWFKICPKVCMNVVWYQQPRWKKMIKEDQAFRQKALQHIPKEVKNDLIN